MVIFLFWLALGMPLYVYGGFPLLIVLAGYWRRRTVACQPVTPTVSLIIVAYNEAAHIAERLDNALRLDYPAEALELLVASDGSTDATEALVASYASRGVRLLRLPRRGKIPALNAAVAQAGGELCVFSDANTLFDRQALRMLARNFADPAVGGVAGRKIYTRQTGSDTSSDGECLYWTYDTWLKRQESWTGSIVAADGAIYAIRRILYQPLSDVAVTDDFAISTAVVAQGWRLVFEPAACAYETAIPASGREFQRKIRLMTRGLRGLWRRKALLNPWRMGFYAVVLASHKLLRRLVPVFLVLLGVSSLWVSAQGAFYAAALWAQLGFYGLAALGCLLRHTRLGRQPWLVVPFYYCLANAAALVALLKALRGEQIALWQPQRHETS